MQPGTVAWTWNPNFSGGQHRKIPKFNGNLGKFQSSKGAKAILYCILPRSYIVGAQAKQLTTQTALQMSVHVNLVCMNGYHVLAVLVKHKFL